MNEKAPDTPRPRITYAGIAVESRWGKGQELETMMSAIDLVAEWAPDRLPHITHVFCDSNPGADYRIQCHTGHERDLADLFQPAFSTAGGGYNGISVESDQQVIDINPWWIDDIL